MSDTKYAPGGVLFSNTRKTASNHPDFTGTLEISEDLLRLLLSKAKAGQPIKMDLSAWKKNSPKAGTFLSMLAKAPYVKPDNGWEEPAPVKTRKAATIPSQDIDDEIPF